MCHKNPHLCDHSSAAVSSRLIFKGQINSTTWVINKYFIMITFKFMLYTPSNSILASILPSSRNSTCIYLRSQFLKSSLTPLFMAPYPSTRPFKTSQHCFVKIFRIKPLLIITYLFQPPLYPAGVLHSSHFHYAS